MRISPHQKLISWLLAALLLVNGIGAQGFNHAHAEGNESHSHANDGMVAHVCGVHRNSHHGDHPTEQPHHGDGDLTPTRVLHTHLSLFGLVFSIPDSEDTHDADEVSQSSSFLRLNDQRNVLLVDRYLDMEFLRTLTLAATFGDAVANHVAVLTSSQVASTPLCDSARFERTGVLLI